MTVLQLPDRLAAPAAPATFLDIDPAVFRASFDRRPFFIGHHLADHPLFTLARLVELSRRLPEAHVEYNAGDLPVSLDPSKTPRNGLSVAETIDRIETCRSWLVLKFVEQDPEYRDLLERCLDEVRPHSEPVAPGMGQAEAFIFVSSPGSVTPYHMDPEHNFLLQIRGSKIVHLFDRGVLTEEELEEFYAGRHRNLVFREEYERDAAVFELTPGLGLHFPATAPHWVKNGAAVSASFSVTFRTPSLDRRGALYQANAALRRRGYRPAPVGRSAGRDALVYQGFRAWRRVRKMLGKPVV